MAIHWASKVGFILATAGSAIGLGNIWRFPYLLMQYGGAFLYMYLLCVFGIGFFILISKLAFGRAAQTDFPKGFDKVAKQTDTVISPLWAKTANFLSLTNITGIGCIYLVVMGWTVCYAVLGIVNLFVKEPLVINQTVFTGLTQSFGFQLFWAVVCAILAFLILSKGVQKGIERICVVMMPLLFLSLIFLAVWLGCVLDLHQTIKFIFAPDLTKVGILPGGIELRAFGNALLAALGQSIYSLSLGFGTIFIYGSYMNKKTDIVKSVKYIVLMDTFVALLAGFIVISVLLHSDITSVQGPELSFITIPLVFNEMMGGKYLLSAFFILLFLAALTSLVSMFEPMINLLVNEKKYSRVKASFYTVFMILIGSSIILSSFCRVWNISLFNLNLFDLMDKLTGQYTMPLVIVLCSLFMGRKIFPSIISEIQTGHTKPLSLIYKKYLYCVLKWLVPMIVTLLLISVIVG